jgi:hypothetical protein
MPVFGLPWLDRLTMNYRSVEFEGDWLNHAFELGDLVRRRHLHGPVHLIVYSGNEYVDMDELYMRLEPFIHDLEGVTVTRASSVESIVYSLSLLDKVREGTVFIILPYLKDMPSQNLSTRLPLLRDAVDYAEARGWRIIIVNPILTPGKKIPAVWIVNRILRLTFDDEMGGVRVEMVRIPIVRMLPAYPYIFK